MNELASSSLLFFSRVWCDVSDEGEKDFEIKVASIVSNSSWKINPLLRICPFMKGHGGACLIRPTKAVN